MEREAQLQDKLKNLIEGLIQKGYKFAGFAPFPHFPFPTSVTPKELLAVSPVKVP